MANFVETEQLLSLPPPHEAAGSGSGSGSGPRLFSYVQVRGSIPLMWTQLPNIKYKPPTVRSCTVCGTVMRLMLVVVRALGPS